MKMIFDSESDTLTIILADREVHESDEDKEGIILDYDKDGSLVSLEILDASKKIPEPNSITLESRPAAA